MLENIKACIESLPDISFEQYYVNYIMRVQDQNIDEELRYLRRANSLDPLIMMRAIGDSFERMKTQC